MRENRQFGSPLIVPTSSEMGTVTRLKRISYDREEDEGAGHDEEWLQQNIHRYPEILPIGELEPAYQPVVPVCTELPTPRGHVDNFYVTPHGNLIFAECKLWRNAEARRKVVAQVIDYIEGMSRWTCEDLETAATKANASKGTGKTKRLYDLIEQEPDSLDEQSFNDAISRNLRLGRGLFLIVGDGIREEAETLVNHVGAHPGLHFSLALVEIAVFRLPDDGGYLCQPRTIARTVNVERAVVRVVEGQASVSGLMMPSGAANLGEGEFFEDLTAEHGTDLANRFREFLPKLAFLDVDVEFGTASLIPKWSVTDQFRISLCHVHRNGMFLTNNVFNADARKRGLDKVVREYLEDVAVIIGGTIDFNADTEYPSVKRHGKIPRIDDILDHEGEWLSCIQKLQENVKKIEEDGS